MHPEIAAFAERANLHPEQAAELDALFARRAAAEPATRSLRTDTVAVDLDRTWLDDDPGTEAPVATADRPAIGGRYEDLGPIGTGGMGEVRRVRDLELNRIVAMKRIHGPLLDRAGSLARFLDEAQATAQLQHPNIVPIHDLGIDDDGRVWFTMREVRGRTLAEVVREVHAASGFGWETGAQGWTFRRTVAAFLSVCHAVAYAHERGVVHRDLKPENVMVGTHGEVYVLDWGLAKLVGRPDDGEADEEAVITSRDATLATRIGTIAGTPSYMAPEQARGEIDRIDARTDVYSLGAILYEILAGRRAHGDADVALVLARVARGLFEPLPDQPRIPTDLARACQRAMAPEPEDRFPSASALADEIAAWLDGARKREQARAIADQALEGVAQAAGMGAQAAALEAEGEALLAGVASWLPEDAKVPGWDALDRAAALRRSADLQQLAVDQGLHGALRVAPDLPDAHAALAERYLARHTAAEEARDDDGAARARTLVRLHADALPETHPTRTRCEAHLRGDGALTLVTDPPGAEVTLYRYAVHHRRRVEVEVGSLGRTPLSAVSLPMGSYLCVITHPDCETVRYPAEVPRQGHWDGVAPGDRAPTPIWLPPRGALGDDAAYVPAGWFRSGGDPFATNSHPAHRLWCPGFAIHRTPITNTSYLAFLHDLVDRGRVDEALRWAPRETTGALNEQGPLIYGFDGSRFSLQADAEGDLWQPDWPVFMVDWYCARAYLDWLAERTGRPWRLPAEREWEKAARGVDGRWYPWGDHCDPSWCSMIGSVPGTPQPASVDAFPIDVSPCGARGLGGNVGDWCLGPGTLTEAPLDGRVPPAVVPDLEGRALLPVCGGHWHGSRSYARSAGRFRNEPLMRVSAIGFRGIFPVG